MATRLLNMISGLIVLATGAYVGYRFAGVMPDPVRWLLLGAAISYFVVQAVKLIAAECGRVKRCSSMALTRNLELDNGHQ